MFNLFREYGLPSFHGVQPEFLHLSNMTNIQWLGFFSIIFITFFVFLVGIRTTKCFYTFLYGTATLLIGLFIILCNYGIGWSVSSLEANVSYKVSQALHVQARLGVYVGLRGVNVTLKGEPIHQLNERIDYNENFDWTWQQGKTASGPESGKLQKQYMRAKKRGIPTAILWIMEHFIMDGEGQRCGRLYRMAGYFTHIFLWTALILWVLSNILIYIIIRYSGYFWLLTGSSLLTSCIVYYSIQSRISMQIQLTKDILFTFRFGWAFWTTLALAVISLFLGLTILIFDEYFPEKLTAFFGLDILQEYEEYFSSVCELNNNRERGRKEATSFSDLEQIILKDIEEKDSSSPYKDGSNSNRVVSGLRRKKTISKETVKRRSLRMLDQEMTIATHEGYNDPRDQGDKREESFAHFTDLPSQYSALFVFNAPP